jgi:two-component system response regulator YesN
MLRVMFVDDEPMALEGLALLIDWKKEGFAICASCKSGAEALKSLPNAKPHLIMTDIRMQDMDGLTLMSEAREHGYEGAFIVVSGYSEFEYAKKAMRIGVAGYLLKPIDPFEASQALEQVRKELISKELQYKLPLAAYQQAVTALLSGQPSGRPALPEGTWQLFTWGTPLPYEDAAAILEEFANSGIQASTHVADEKEWLVLHAKDPLDNAVTDFLNKAMQSRHRELIRSPQTNEASRLYDFRLAICKQLDDCNGELVRRTQELAEAVSLLQHTDFERMAESLISFCVLRGNAVKAQAYELFHALCAAQFEKDQDKLGRLLCESTRDIQALGHLAMQLLTPSPKRISDHVADFVKEHQAQSLTLNSVAATLNYNATYLGRVFHEETGMGFPAWLNRFRMQQAEQMLSNSNMPIHKVAGAVGYGQYKRFLKHFKRQYGQTPQEYRQNRENPL